MVAKLTIAMPVYNDLKYLEDTIESIQNQVFDKFKLVILDDCSSDKSRELIMKKAKRDSRIILHQNESNIGNLKSFLKLIDFCDTEYFCWIGSHDLLNEMYYDLLIQELDSNENISYAYGRLVTIDEQGKEISKAPKWILSEQERLKGGLEKFFMSIGKSRSNETHFHGVYRSRILRHFGERHQSTYVGWDHIVVSMAFYYGALLVSEAEFNSRIFQQRKTTTYQRVVGVNNTRAKLAPTFLSLMMSYAIEFWNLPVSHLRKSLYFPYLLYLVKVRYNIKIMRNIYYACANRVKFLLKIAT
jgi:protein O-GlcNAc transferase